MDGKPPAPKLESGTSNVQLYILNLFSVIVAVKIVYSVWFVTVLQIIYNNICNNESFQILKSFERPHSLLKH